MSVTRDAYLRTLLVQRGGSSWRVIGRGPAVQRSKHDSTIRQELSTANSSSAELLGWAGWSSQQSPNGSGKAVVSAPGCRKTPHSQ